MKISKYQIALASSIAALVIFAVPARAQTTFTSSGSNTGGVYDWSDAANWSAGVPNLNSTTNTAIIGDGNNVGYYAGAQGDLIISGGATLYITSGTFAYASGGNYLDLGRGATTPGNGNLVINGGVFTQSTYESSNPFNAEGPNNTFLISSGTLNLNPAVNFTLNQTNLSWTQSGGVVNGPGAGAEFDVAGGAQMVMTGGQFNFAKLMNLNGVTNAISFSGGLFIDNAGADQGWYGPGADEFNFTVGSSGTLEFAVSGASQSQVQTFVNDGYISYNDTTTPADFTVATVGSYVEVTDNLAIPEPSSYALMGFGSLAIWVFLRRKKARLVG